MQQYNPADVTLERQGDLDDPTYIETLSEDHSLRSNENVFAFGLGAGSLEAMQFLQMVVAPASVSDIGSQHYNFKTGKIDLETRGCNANCPYSTQLVAVGEGAFFSPLGDHPAAEAERAARRATLGRRDVRVGRWADRVHHVVDLDRVARRELRRNRRGSS